jgi:hypothetical protein
MASPGVYMELKTKKENRVHAITYLIWSVMVIDHRGVVMHGDVGG